MFGGYLDTSLLNAAGPPFGLDNPPRFYLRELMGNTSKAKKYDSLFRRRRYFLSRIDIG